MPISVSSVALLASRPSSSISPHESRMVLSLTCTRSCAQDAGGISCLSRRENATAGELVDSELMNAGAEVQHGLVANDVCGAPNRSTRPGRLRACTAVVVAGREPGVRATASGRKWYASS